MSQFPWFALPRLPPDTPRRAAVVGAGLAGAAVAYSLAVRGWEVIVVDRCHKPAGEASGNPTGVLMPRIEASLSPTQRWYAAGFSYTLERLKHLGAAVEWSSCGVLAAAWNERERQRHATLLQRLGSLAEGVRLLNAAQAAAICGLPVGWEALFIAGGGWVHPPSLCRAQLATARLLFNRRIDILERRRGEWSLLDAEGGEVVRAPVVVIAAGSNAARFSQTRHLPLRIIRGQISLATATARSRKLRLVVSGPGFVIPARHDIHCVGATYNAFDADPQPSAADHRRNREMLENLFPAMAEALPASPIAGRAGFRAISRDHLPLVGPAPDEAAFREAYAELWRGRRPSRYPAAPCLPGLYFSIGHGSRGLASTPLAGELLAAMIEGQALPVAADLAEAVHPARFLIRELNRRDSRLAVTPSGSSTMSHWRR